MKQREKALVYPSGGVDRQGGGSSWFLWGTYEEIQQVVVEFLHHSFMEFRRNLQWLLPSTTKWNQLFRDFMLLSSSYY